MEGVEQCRRFPQGEKMRHKESPSKFTLVLPKCILPQSTKFNQKKARCK